MWNWRIKKQHQGTEQEPNCKNTTHLTKIERERKRESKCSSTTSIGSTRNSVGMTYRNAKGLWKLLLSANFNNSIFKQYMPLSIMYRSTSTILIFSFQKGHDFSNLSPSFFNSTSTMIQRKYLFTFFCPSPSLFPKPLTMFFQLPGLKIINHHSLKWIKRQRHHLSTWHLQIELNFDFASILYYLD